MLGWWVNNELDIVSNEALLTKLEVMSHCLLGRTEDGKGEISLSIS
jgi:hypothetical protein